MSFENLLLWLSFMVPLILSPGPANLAISSLAGSFGLRKTMPFVMGLLVWNLFASLVIGLSFSALHAHFDELFHILELLGCFYIFYLAYTFYQISLQQLKPVQADKRQRSQVSFQLC